MAEKPMRNDLFLGPGRPERCRGPRPALRRGLFLLGFAAVGVSGLAFAQEPSHETYSVAEGLISRDILDLAQDSTGRLWILDAEGVTAYDGSRFESRSAGVVPSSDLGALAVDESDRIWVASGEGPDLYRLDADGWSSLPRVPESEGDTTPRIALGMLFEGDRATVAAAGGSGLWLWRSGPDGLAAPARPKGALPSEQITALTPFDGKLAVGTAAGLCFLSFSGSLDCDVRRRFPKLAEMIHATSAETLPEGRERLWVFADSSGGLRKPSTAWLGRIQDGELTTVLEPPAFAPVLLQSPKYPKSWTEIVLDPVGGMYFGTRWSLSYLAPDLQDGIKPVHLRRRLPSVGVNTLLVDRESNVWLGGSRGLDRLHGLRFWNYDRDDGLIEDEVSAAIEATPGTFVLGHNLGVTIIEGREISTLAFELPSGFYRNDFRVVGMEVGPEGDVWLAASKMGLLRLSLESRRLSRELPAASSARAVARDGSGRLWVATPEGLFVRTERGFDLAHAPEGIETARRMLLLDDGRILVTTDDGLLVLGRDGRWSKVAAPSAESSQLTALLVRRSGDIWVGSSDFPSVLRQGQLVPIGDGFPGVSGRIFLLLEDPEGRVWIGTADGVHLWDGEQLRHLTVRHGLAGREINRGAGLVDARGRVWIGTDRGISMYQAKHDRPIPAPRLELSGVDSNGKLLPLDQELRLAPRFHQLVFRFRAVTFSKEEELQISYRLEGLEDELQGPSALKASEVRYTNLGPGTYRFRIRAGWPGGSWSEEQVSAPILIPVPIWRTSSFRWSMVLGTAGLILLLSSLRIRAARARAADLEAVNLELRRSAEERELLIADLEARNLELDRFTFTVSHDLKSPLVTIRGFLGFLAQARAMNQYDQMDEDIARIDEAASKMGRLLDDLTALARVGRIVDLSERVPLNPLIQEVLGLFATSLQERRMEVDVAPDLPEVAGDRLRLRTVFQHLIDNAIKFTREQPNPKISVHAQTVGDRARITVADNGKGILEQHRDLVFGLFKRLDQSVSGTGVGLPLVQRIVEAHGGRIWVESEGEGQGSRFIVDLPTERSEARAADSLE